MSTDFQLSLACSKCGCEKFKFPGEPSSSPGTAGCICANCGEALTENDIQEYVSGVRLGTSYHMARMAAAK